MNLMANRFLDEYSLTEQPSSLTINVIDQESQEPPKETTILLWDSNHMMPFKDATEVHGPPAEFLVV
jgi:hypothetical protein